MHFTVSTPACGMAVHICFVKMPCGIMRGKAQSFDFRIRGNLRVMKVILTQTVPGVGEAGSVKEVADGYARNFLLPRKLAVMATKGMLKQAEAQADTYARKANKAKESAQAAADSIRDKSVRIRARVGSENRLYGSVTSADIADALKEQIGIELDRRKITLAEAIHRTGTYTATADFGNGVTSNFNVEVMSEAAGAFGTKVAGAAEADQAEASEDVTPATEAQADEQVEANPS